MTNVTTFFPSTKFLIYEIYDMHIMYVCLHSSVCACVRVCVYVFQQTRSISNTDVKNSNLTIKVLWKVTLKGTNVCTLSQ
jgi:hypothetical protein